MRIPHQAVLEFMAVVTRVRIGAEPLLTRETEELLDQFRILYPDTWSAKNGSPRGRDLPATLV